MTNQALLDSVAYKTYYAIALGAEPPISRKRQKKSDSAISSEESPSKKKYTKAKKVAATKPKPTKKKAPAKDDRGKGLNVLSKVALTEAEQLKMATKRSKTQFHISHASGSGDGVDTQSKVPDEQHFKTTGADKGTDSGEEDDDNDDGGSDDHDDDSDDKRTESDDEMIHDEEKIDDEEKLDEEEEDEVTKELYKDVNMNLSNEDAKMTKADQAGADQQNVSQESGFEQVEEDAYVTLTLVIDTQKTDGTMQSSSISSDFTSKLLNLENPSLADNEIASLMETLTRHATTVPKITSGFATTIPLPPQFFNPLPHQATPTPTTFEATTSFPLLPNFSSVFKFNERVTNLEKDLSEIKQVDQYAQALSSIHTLIDEKNAQIGLIDTSMRTIIREEVTTQLPQILPQAVSDFATPMIEKNVTESLEVAVLARYSSQPKSTYEAAALLSEFELTKILLDKMEESKSHLRADYKKKLYDALVESYNTDKDLFNSYGEVFTLKRSRDDSDKDRDPSAGSDRGKKRRKSSKEAESSIDSRSKEKKSSSTSKDASQSQLKSSGKSAHAEEPMFTLKRSRDDSDKDRDPSAGSDRGKKRRKSSKEVESSRDSRSKKKKSSSTSKDASQSQHKSSDKSAHAEEPSHIVEDSGTQQDKEFVAGDNDEQPADKETWMSQVASAKEPRTSFDELMDTSFDFSAFVLNRLNIKDLTQEILATTERLDWHNPEGKPYPFDLSKPLPLIRDHRGRQVISQDFFINNDLEYLKGGDLSRRYSTSVTKTKAATYEIKWIEDLVRNLWSPVTVKYDKHAYWGTSHWGPKRQRFYGFDANMSLSKDVYSRKRIIAVTRLTIMEKYDYGHLEEIEVRRDDQKLYKFREGDFPRLRLQDIEDMLLLLVQQKLTNLTIDERYALNVALRMFTRRIVIQRRVEDLQLGVKSYQKKLNLTKPDTFRSNLRDKTTYTAYSDPKGVIYKDQNNRNRLMRADELHKFSDGTLNDVRTALNDIAKGIRMKYLPKRKWSELDKRRAQVMVQDIDKQLYERRLMQNLEKFVGGREYGNDLRLLERTI
ncbi:hypothetical protein Tco_1346271 [Tanacetum coccineum]